MASFFKKFTSKSSQSSQAPRYFFDDDKPDPNGSEFWSKKQIEIDSKKINSMNGYVLYKKSKKKFGDLKLTYICLYKNYLVVSKSKEKIHKANKCLDISKHFLTLHKKTPPSRKFAAGISLCYNQKEIELFSKSADELNSFLSLLKKNTIQTNFEDTYILDKKLGAGSYAEVYRVRDKLTQKSYAAKFFEISSFKDHNKSKVTKIQIALNFSKIALKNEVNIHRQLEHRNICRIHEVYENSTHIIVVMDYAKGQRLLDYVIDNSPLPEKEALKIIKELMETVLYLHLLGIIHRDIKLENVMIDKEASELDQIKIRLIDFGLSAKVDNIELFKRSGTPGYVAPEILVADTYDTQVDVFSLGVILFTINNQNRLSGRSPFVGPDRETVLRLNKKCEFEFKPKYWQKISSNSKNLVQRMMEAQPEKRITVQEALNHQVFCPSAIHSAQSIKSSLKELGTKLSLNPPGDAPKQELILPKFQEKSKTTYIDTIDSRSRPSTKSNQYSANRSYSARSPEHASQNIKRLPSNNNPNLLQIPQSHVIFPTIEAEEEKAELSIPYDGINKGSLRSFYKLNSDFNTEEPNSPFGKSERHSIIAPHLQLQEIYIENQLKTKAGSYKEMEKSLKFPWTLNTPSYDPSVAESLNEVELNKVQSCDISLESNDNLIGNLPKPPRIFKASMSHIKKATKFKQR